MVIVHNKPQNLAPHNMTQISRHLRLDARTIKHETYRDSVHRRKSSAGGKTVEVSCPDLREPFYVSIWFGQGVIWGGHSMFCFL